jgi:hypothetical protein
VTIVAGFLLGLTILTLMQNIPLLLFERVLYIGFSDRMRYWHIHLGSRWPPEEEHRFPHQGISTIHHEERLACFPEFC